MEARRISESMIFLAQVMNPADANPFGGVHGGTIMKLIDTAAGSAAVKHSRSMCATASIDRLDFHHPVFVGDLLTLKASVNYTGRTSMEVGVRVESQNLLTGEIRHTVSAYLTLVALSPDRKPVTVPPLILETPVQERRYNEAQARRQLRSQERSVEESR